MSRDEPMRVWDPSKERCGFCVSELSSWSADQQLKLTDWSQPEVAAQFVQGEHPRATDGRSRHQRAASQPLSQR